MTTVVLTAAEAGGGAAFAAAQHDGDPHPDSEDHTATAWFTCAAYADHPARRGPSAVRLDAYVGYGNARWRHNLGGPSEREKTTPSGCLRLG